MFMTDIYDRRDKWGKTKDDVVDELLQEKGISTCAGIAGVGEGELPTGIEAESGYILAPDGKIWAYMTKWDPEKTNPDGEKGYYTLFYLDEVDLNEWKNSPDYFRAREQLDLPLTEEQEKTLQQWKKEHP